MTKLFPLRIDALRSRMVAEGVDMMLISATSDMQYTIGKRLPNTERFNALAIGLTGKPRLIVPQLQVPLVVELGDSIEIVAWAETQDPIHLLAEMIETSGVRSLAVDGLMRSAFLLRLQARVGGGVHFSNGTALSAQVRLIKDADEISVLRELGKRFDAIWDTFWSKGRLVGTTEREVVEQIRKLLFAHGFESMDWCDVGSGPNGASPLHHHSDRVIQPGDPVVIDFAGTVGGYFMDTCRTPIAGEPDPAFAEIHRIVQSAHDAANSAARPGIPACEVDEAARNVITKAGFGDRFIHRLGHGMGLDPHEEPYIVSGNTLPLASGMVYSNEPGIYIPGKWGVRIEDIILMTDAGAHSLNACSRDIVTMN